MMHGRLPVLLIGLLLCGCGGERDPVVEMQRSLASAPAYMIVLDDMREEGSFFTKYYHRYLITQGDKKVQTDWIEVSESIYKKYEPFLGMALVAKSEKDGVNNTPHPPGVPLCGQSGLRALGGSRRHVVLGVLRAIRADAGFARLGRRVWHESLRLRRLSVSSPRPPAVLRTQSGIRYAGIRDAKTKAIHV